ncbi:MAG: cysteine peptidase family C39 domain-containing protein [Methanobacterium sp.]|nr:cysteine peptidase family C39 domain-containing protein [Methanobacterium sp.]
MYKRQLIGLFLIAIFVGSPFANVVSAAETVSYQNTKTAYTDTCGSITLQKVLKDHGIQALLEEIDQLSKADESGTTMLNLINAAKTKGLNLVGKKYPQCIYRKMI